MIPQHGYGEMLSKHFACMATFTTPVHLHGDKVKHLLRPPPPPPPVQRARSNHPTVLDVVTADDPDVLNVLIDQCRIESVLLIEERDAANRVIVHNRPSGANRVRCEILVVHVVAMCCSLEGKWFGVLFANLFFYPLPSPQRLSLWREMRFCRTLITPIEAAALGSSRVATLMLSGTHTRREGGREEHRT